VFNFAIDQHVLNVIEIEGNPIVPTTVEYIRLNPGQRIDVLVTANQNISNYWIQATIDRSYFFEPHPWFVAWMVRAVFHYEGSPNQLPPVDRLQIMDQMANKSFEEGSHTEDQQNFFSYPGTIPESTRQIVVSIDWYLDPDTDTWWPLLNNRSYAYVNHTTLPPPPGSPLPNMTSPELFWYSTALNFLRAGLPIPPQLNPVYIENGEVIDLVINNHDNAHHPMHIHGHNFWVVGMGNRLDGDYNPDKFPLNTVNPVRRDSVTVNGNSYVVLRFVANNPGIWFVHCHMDWHLVSGMAMIFVESPQLILQQYGKTPQLEYCVHLMNH
jgi:iron transport multicopper oxidase